MGMEQKGKFHLKNTTSTTANASLKVLAFTKLIIKL